MTTYTSGRIEITAEAQDPIIHGAGVAGNTQLLRTQDIVSPDGEEISVPFVSGASLKHEIRDGSVRFALDVMGVPDGTLTKPVVDLLFSGGHLGKGGQAVRLDRARELEHLFPLLSVCGYSAGNTMVASKLSIDNLQLVCAENTWRTPERLQEHAHTELSSWQFRGEEFGTRHEASKQPRVARMLDHDHMLALVAETSAKSEKDGAVAKIRGSSQMLFDFQVVKPGAVFWGEIRFRDLTDLELSALRAGIGYACIGRDGERFVMHVGAKRSVGYGRVACTLEGSIRHVSVPSEECTDLAPAVGTTDEVAAELAAYVAHLRQHQDEIISLLREVA